MGEPTERDHIDLDEAASLLEVPREQVTTMVDQGLLEPVGDGGDEPRFVRAEVLAVRQMGG